MNFNELNSLTPPGWTGKYPPCQIQVDREGSLFHNGAPIIHPGIRELIFAALRYEDGLYFLELEGKRCQLQVEDAFYVVMRAELVDGQVSLSLNSGNLENLDPDSLWVGENDVLYCRISGGDFPARFSRPAYYQLAQWIEEADEGFALRLNGRKHLIDYPAG